MHDNQNVPQQFADFNIVRIIGQGAIGVVYEAFQQSSNDRVALKVFSPWIGLTTNAFSNFRGQIERLTQFKQDGIVRVITCGQSGLRPDYVTQLVRPDC